MSEQSNEATNLALALSNLLPLETTEGASTSMTALVMLTASVLSLLSEEKHQEAIEMFARQLRQFLELPSPVADVLRSKYHH